MFAGGIPSRADQFGGMIDLRRVTRDDKSITIITLLPPGDFEGFVALRDCEGVQMSPDQFSALSPFLGHA